MTGSLVHFRLKPFTALLKSEQHQIFLCYILMFLRGGGVCTQAMFYNTHSSQELRTQPHRTNSIATLTTSGLTKFSLFPSSRPPHRSLALCARLYSPLTRRQNFHGRKFTKRDLTSYRLASHVFLSFRTSTRLGG